MNFTGKGTEIMLKIDALENPVSQLVSAILKPQPVTHAIVET